MLASGGAAAEKAIKAVRHASAIDLHDKDKRDFTHNHLQLAKPLNELSGAMLPAALGALTFHESDGRYPSPRTGVYRAPVRVYTIEMAYVALVTAERVVIACNALVQELHTFWRARP